MKKEEGKKKRKVLVKRNTRIEEISVGIDLLNLLAGGGVPPGIINLVGDSGSGKSYLAGEILAAIYHHYKGKINWYYDSVEEGYRFDSMSMYGFDVLRGGCFSEEATSETIQDFEAKINDILNKRDFNKSQKIDNVPFVYILDSFDSLSSEDELKYMNKKRKAAYKKKKEKETEDSSETKESGTYNLEKQKFMHQFCRVHIKRLVREKIFVIIISQIKDNIGVMFGAKSRRMGGKALDFYPNIVWWLAEAEKYIKKARTIGVCVKIKSTKSRSKWPFRSCYIDLIFDYGVDNISSNLKFLYDLKTEKGKDKGKSEFNNLLWDEREFNFNELVSYIEEHGLEKELSKRVIEKWETIEDSISSKNRKRKWGREV